EEQPPAEGDVRSLIHQARSLLEPTERQPEQGGSPFGSRYFEALQREPAVVLAHAEVARLLQEESAPCLRRSARTGRAPLRRQPVQRPPRGERLEVLHRRGEDPLPRLAA